MANIEQLNFELIINDQQFNEKIQGVIQTATQMNTEVTNLLSNLDKVGRGGGSVKKNQALEALRTEIKSTESAIASLEQKYKSLYKNAGKDDTGVFIANPKVDEKFRDLTNQAEALRKKLVELKTAYNNLGGNKALASSMNTAKGAASDTNIELLRMRDYYKQVASDANATASSQGRVASETNKANAAMKTHSKLWGQVAALATTYFSIYGAKALVRELVSVSAEFEKQRISLEAILNDIQGADRIFSQIKGLAVESPFQFKELVTYVKQLSAYSIPMEELYNTTKMLADVSAGLGVGMDRLVLAYGQIRSAAFLRGFNIYGLSASKGVKNTNPFNCWDSHRDNQQPRCFAA